ESVAQGAVHLQSGAVVLAHLLQGALSRFVEGSETAVGTAQHLVVLMLAALCPGVGAGTHSTRPPSTSVMISPYFSATSASIIPASRTPRDMAWRCSAATRCATGSPVFSQRS